MKITPASKLEKPLPNKTALNTTNHPVSVDVPVPTEQTGIMKAIEWLASFFKYKEILKTAEILEAAAIHGVDQFIATIPSEGAIKEFFNELRLMLEKKT